MKRSSANMYEVAKLADVSIATVSRVINTGTQASSEKTRQKVLSAMLKLGYQPNSIAQSLATRTSNSVGVLVSELHGAFYGSMLSAIEETLRAAGKFVLVATGHDREDQEREGIRFLVGRNCDALIVHVAGLPDKFLVEQNAKHTPIVIVNRKVRGIADRCFSLDNELGGYLAAQFAPAGASTGRSPISPARSTGPTRTSACRATSARSRRRAWRSTSGCCTKVTITRRAAADGAQCICSARTSRSPPWSARTTRWRPARWRPRTIAGLKLPDELSIVGFDDAPISRYIYPKLSTVHYPITDMGHMAARWVLQNVYQHENLDVRQRVFKPNFVDRDSVAPPG